MSIHRLSQSSEPFYTHINIKHKNGVNESTKETFLCVKMSCLSGKIHNTLDK